MKKIVLASSLILLAGCGNSQDQSEEMHQFVNETLTNFANNMENYAKEQEEAKQKLLAELQEKNEKDFPYNPVSVNKTGEIIDYNKFEQKDEQYKLTVNSYNKFKGIHTEYEVLEAKSDETFVLIELLLDNVGTLEISNIVKMNFSLKASDGSIFKPNYENLDAFLDAYNLVEEKETIQPKSKGLKYLLFNVNEQFFDNNNFYIQVEHSEKVEGMRNPSIITTDIPVK